MLNVQLSKAGVLKAVFIDEAFCIINIVKMRKLILHYHKIEFVM